MFFVADSMSLSSPPGVHSPKGFEQSHVPKEICSLSEDLQNLIMGRVSEAKTATRTRKIVIYVCAADSQGICLLYLLELFNWDAFRLLRREGLAPQYGLPRFACSL